MKYNLEREDEKNTSSSFGDAEMYSDLHQGTVLSGHGTKKRRK